MCAAARCAGHWRIGNQLIDVSSTYESNRRQKYTDEDTESSVHTNALL